jgi:hypothetical protein
MNKSAQGRSTSQRKIKHNWDNVKLLTCGLESENLTGIEHDQGQEN